MVTICPSDSTSGYLSKNTEAYPTAEEWTDHYPVMKKSEAVPYTAAWMDLESMLSESRPQRQDSIRV